MYCISVFCACVTGWYGGGQRSRLLSFSCSQEDEEENHGGGAAIWCRVQTVSQNENKDRNFKCVFIHLYYATMIQPWNRLMIWPNIDRWGVSDTKICPSGQDRMGHRIHSPHQLQLNLHNAVLYNHIIRCLFALQYIVKWTKCGDIFHYCSNIKMYFPLPPGTTKRSISTLWRRKQHKELARGTRRRTNSTRSRSEDLMWWRLTDCL